MTQSLIYVTASSRDEAIKIGRQVVENRLAACANVLAGTASIYWWEGAVTEDEEVSLILKTRAELVDRVVEKVKEIHSYDCPCVVALPITGGNPAFLDWIDAETAETSE
ncbi:MAG: divalent-cation tolerance protein CutA [Rhodospirillaceae bacterium]|jgi:periplasmic divalent cation tolerance protein|nr:divalent-cation tolerance protein CutA [Rhodospirillaceae bacterium]|tara:strand:- start:72 stop:398 length:327 start_codon:yes stop_codon:yes gene_type:complete